MKLKKLILGSFFSTVLFGSLTPGKLDPPKKIELPTLPLDQDHAAIELAAARVKAQRGGSDAEAELGVMLLGGDKSIQNHKEARIWLLKAAQKGNSDAQAKLAAVYFLGLGGEANRPEAIKWFKAAADQGEVYSMACLGIFYASGTVVEKDLVTGFVWLYLAKLGGDPDVENPLHQVGRLLSEDQQKEAERRINAYLESLAGPIKN